MALSGPPHAANQSLNFSLFLFGCAGSWLLHVGLLWLQQAGPALCCGARLLTVAASPAAEHGL